MRDALEIPAGKYCVDRTTLILSLNNVQLNLRCGQDYVFTRVCDSVNTGGVSASVHAGIPPSGADPSGSRHPPEQTPCLSACWDTPPWSGLP